MIIYRIDNDVTNVTRFASAKAKATATVTELVSENGGKRADYVIKEIDLDTRKEGLLDFLNKLCEVKEERGA